jgi:predicted nucleic acid-binding protein
MTSASDVAHYLDSSALVKLVVEEAESVALVEWLGAAPRVLVSADLARTELLRAVRRVAPDLMLQAREVLDTVTLIKVGTETFEQAGRLDPVELRTLDALHVAAALQLGDELTGLVTYDHRQAAAANANGIDVVAPGSEPRA